MYWDLRFDFDGCAINNKCIFLFDNFLICLFIYFYFDYKKNKRFFLFDHHVFDIGVPSQSDQVDSAGKLSRLINTRLLAALVAHTRAQLARTQALLQSNGQCAVRALHQTNHVFFFKVHACQSNFFIIYNLLILVLFISHFFRFRFTFMATQIN